MGILYKDDQFTIAWLCKLIIDALYAAYEDQIFDATIGNWFPTKYLKLLHHQFVLQELYITILFYICDWTCERGLPHTIFRDTVLKYSIYYILPTYKAACVQLCTKLWLVIHGLWLDQLHNV